MASIQTKRWLAYIVVFAVLFMNSGNYVVAAELQQTPDEHGKIEGELQISYQEQRQLLLENLHAESSIKQERSIETMMDKEYFSIGMVVLVVAVIIYVMSFATLLVLMIRGNDQDGNRNQIAA